MTTLRRQLTRNVDIHSSEQLRGYFRQFVTGGRPKRIGCEIEWLPVDHQGRAVPYDAPNGACTLLQRLETERGWKPVEVDGHTLAVQKGDIIIGLEPGGQVEYSSAPHTGLHTLLEEYLAVRADLAAAKKGLDLLFLSLGVQPFLRRTTSLPIVPKSRYLALASRLNRSGALGHWMMKATASIQVNLDYADEAEGAEILRAAANLSRRSAGLFSNSPLWKGRLASSPSVRRRIWQDTDPTRCGLPQFMLQPGLRLEDYIRYALDVPVVFCDTCPPGYHRHTFKEWIASRRPHPPRMRDWDLHLTSLYPDVRLKPQIELRFIDALPDPTGMAAIALCKGILYSPRTRKQLLQRTVNRRVDRFTADELLEAGREGLLEHDPNEVPLLEPLHRFSGRPFLSPAQETIREWRSSRSPSDFVLRIAW